MIQHFRKMHPGALVVRISGPATLKRQIARAQQLYNEGAKVIIYIDDLDEICKLHDADTIAELIGSIPLYEEETDEGAGSQTD